MKKKAKKIKGSCRANSKRVVLPVPAALRGINARIRMGLRQAAALVMVLALLLQGMLLLNEKTSAYFTDNETSSEHTLKAGTLGFRLDSPDSLSFSAFESVSSIETEEGVIQISSPYSNGAHVYKGQTHLHTVASQNGTGTAAEVLEAYRDAGYDFVNLSDHDYINADPDVSGILFISGVEESPAAGHITRIHAQTDAVSTELQSILDFAATENSFSVLNHPGTTGGVGDHYTNEELDSLNGFNAIEIYNGARTTYENRWDYLLSKDRVICGMAGDDTHDLSAVYAKRSGIKVFADSLAESVIMENVGDCNYYIFYTPDGQAEINLSVALSGNAVTVTSNQQAVIEFIKDEGVVVQTENAATSSSYTILGNEKYIRARVTAGTAKAWTNPIFVKLIEDQHLEADLSKGDSAAYSTKVVKEGSLDFQYTAAAADITGDSDLCDALVLRVELDDDLVYNGPLTGFAAAARDFTEPGIWDFNVALPDSAPDTLQDKTCGFNFAFTGWQRNFSDPSMGFTDTEELSGTVNSGHWVTTPPPASDSVVINEILPDPTGNDDANYDRSDPQAETGEWVELYNNGDQEVNLNGWYLYDSFDSHELEILSSNTHTGTVVIGAKDFLVVYRDGDNDFSLNNNGDTIRLYNDRISQGGTLVDSYTYTVPEECSLTPTPGNTNIDDSSGGCASGSVPENKSIARIPDGSVNWVDPIPTPGGPNKEGVLPEENTDENTIETAITPQEVTTEEILRETEVAPALVPGDDVPGTDEEPQDVLGDAIEETSTGNPDAADTEQAGEDVTGDEDASGQETVGEGSSEPVDASDVADATSELQDENTRQEGQFLESEIAPEQAGEAILPVKDEKDVIAPEPEIQVVPEVVEPETPQEPQEQVIQGELTDE